MQTIFIVDDNETNLVAAQQALAGMYKTLQILSAAKMFVMLENVVPDLILLDLDMPFIDGVEAIHMLKSTARYKNVPIVVLSAITNSETVKIALSLGARDFVTKPFDRDALLMRVSRALQS